MTRFFLVFYLSLNLATTACQTVKKDEGDDTLEQQLAVVTSFLDAGTPDKALAEIRPLYNKHPSNPKVLNIMGLTQLALRNYTQAIDFFKQSYQESPEISTGLNLSATLIESNRVNEAEKVLKGLAAQTQKDRSYQYPERIHHNLGLVAEKKKDAKAAEKSFRQALVLNPTFYPSRLALARTFQNTKRPRLAINTLQEATQNCPVCFEPVEGLVQSYTSLGQKDKAKNAVANYLKVDGISGDDRDKARTLQQALLKK